VLLEAKDQWATEATRCLLALEFPALSKRVDGHVARDRPRGLKSSQNHRSLLDSPRRISARPPPALTVRERSHGAAATSSGVIQQRAIDSHFCSVHAPAVSHLTIASVEALAFSLRSRWRPSATPRRRGASRWRASRRSEGGGRRSLAFTWMRAGPPLPRRPRFVSCSQMRVDRALFSSRCRDGAGDPRLTRCIEL